MARKRKDDFNLPDVPLDEAFVGAANIYEPTAQGREGRAARLRAAAAHQAVAGRERGKRRRLAHAVRGRGTLVVVVIVVMAIGVMSRSERRQRRKARVPSRRRSREQPGGWMTGGDRPLPRAAQSTRPLGTPKTLTTDGS